MTKKVLSSAQETMRAALLNRRTMLRSAAAVGAVGLSSPMLVKNAFSSSGELNLLMWSDEFPDPVIPNFEKATGIKVNQAHKGTGEIAAQLRVEIWRSQEASNRAQDRVMR